MATVVNPFSYALGGGQGVSAGGGGPDGTQYYVEVTIDNTQVASTLTDFPVYVDLSDLPAAFFTNVQSDGGDIRVTESDGTTRCATELVAIDTGASTGELHFLASSISSSVDAVFRIYYDGGGTTLSQPGVATTYGRNAVWSDYAAVYHFNDTTDSTGNSHTLTEAGNAATGSATSPKIGDNVTLDGSNDYVTSGEGGGGLDVTGEMTLQAWVRRDTNNIQMVASKDYRNGGLGSNVSEGYALLLLNTANGSSARFGIRESSTQNAVTGTTALSNSVWYLLHGRRDAAGEFSIAIDGTVEDTSTVGSNSDLSNAAELFWGARETTSVDLELDGRIDEGRLRLSRVSDDWIAAEHTNQNTPTTFYTIGSQTAA